MINYNYADYLHKQYDSEYPGIRQRYIDVICNIEKKKTKNPKRFNVNKKPKKKYSSPDPRIKKVLNGKTRPSYLVTYNEVDYTLKQLSEVFGISFSTLEGRLLRDPFIRVEALITKPKLKSTDGEKSC